ncbi:MAG TPA: M1 family aminopeptidase [Myxococcota bacterium]|nr:M1 family aminopeptidase [Myxococcota bacterium]
MRTFFVAALLSLNLLACGSGSSISVELDPELWLLRDNLPAPGSGGQALRAGPAWGRYLWAPDLSPVGRIESKPLDGPAPELDSAVVSLSLDPAGRTLSGRADIQVWAAGAALDSIGFRLSAAAVDEVTAGGVALTHTYENGVLTCTPDTPLPDGESLTISIAWHDADIELEVEFFPEGFKKNVLVGYLGEPSTFFTFGYWFWPRLVGPATVSDVEFEVTYPDALTLVMSGEEESSKDNGDGTKTDVWRLSNPTAWYVSLALADYEKAESSCGNTAIEVYGMPGKSIDNYPIVPATYLPIMEAICDDYRARFGEPAFGAIRLAGVDQRFTNGYSSPGLLIVPNYTLDDDGKGSFAARDFYIAHEVSHQWWGNDVFASGTDIWLTEGLADYSAISYLEGSNWGADAAREQWLIDAAQLLDYYAQGGVDYPLVPESADELVAYIYYLKGAWVFRMLEGVIGRDEVTRALSDYRLAHPFAEATTQDFITAATAVHGESLAWFFDEWLTGTGLMSLAESHALSGDSVDLSVTQATPWSMSPERFFSMPATVRITRDGSAKDERVTIEGSESTFHLPAGH